MKVEEEQYEDDFEDDHTPQNERDRYEGASDPDSEFDENPLEESNS